jgi:hypothetical protein
MFYELSLGEESFWKPWLDILPDIEMRWADDELVELQDRTFEKRYQKVKSTVENYFEDMLVLNMYFKITREDLFKVRAWVVTRTFVYGDGVAMVPLADCLNHSWGLVDRNYYNLDLHKQEDSTSDYYLIDKFVTNLSELVPGGHKGLVDHTLF